MWFTEDPWPPMIILGICALLALAWWRQNQRLLALGIAVGCLLLAGAVYVVEQWIVTPAELVQQKTVDLCWNFKRKAPETIEAFSDSAPQLKVLCQTAMSLVNVGDDLRLTDLQARMSNEDTRAITHFRANATVTYMGQVGGYQPSRFELTWARENDDWKIIAVRRLNPVSGEELGVLDAGR